MQFRAVNPRQIRALHAHHLALGQFASEAFQQQVVVGGDVFAQLREPFVALVAVSSLQGYHAERVHVAHLVDVYGAVDAVAHLSVAANDVRNLQSGGVERLRRRAAGYRIAAQFVGQRTERHVLVVVERQFAVYLVRHYAHAILAAKLRHACQFVARPHASARIVRVAEQHQSCAFVLELAFEVVEVDFVAQFLLIIYKRVGYHLASVVAY